MVLADNISDWYIGEFDGELQYLWAMYNTENYLDCLPMAYQLKAKYYGDNNNISQIDYFIGVVENNKKNRYRVL